MAGFRSFEDMYPSFDQYASQAASMPLERERYAQRMQMLREQELSKQEAMVMQAYAQQAAARQAFQMQQQERMRQEALKRTEDLYQERQQLLERQGTGYYPQKRAESQAAIAGAQAQEQVAKAQGQRAQGFDAQTYEAAARALGAVGAGRNPEARDAQAASLVYGPQAMSAAANEATKARAHIEAARLTAEAAANKWQNQALSQVIKQYDYIFDKINKDPKSATLPPEQKTARALDEFRRSNPTGYELYRQGAGPHETEPEFLNRLKGAGKTMMLEDIPQPGSAAVALNQAFPEFEGGFPEFQASQNPQGPFKTIAMNAGPGPQPQSPPDAGQGQQIPPPPPGVGANVEWAPLTAAMDTQNPWLLPADVSTQPIDQKEAQRRRDEMLANLRDFYGDFDTGPGYTDQVAGA